MALAWTKVSITGEKSVFQPKKLWIEGIIAFSIPQMVGMISSSRLAVSIRIPITATKSHLHFSFLLLQEKFLISYT